MIFEGGPTSDGSGGGPRFVSRVRGFEAQRAQRNEICVRLGRFRERRGVIVSVSSPGHQISVEEEDDFTLMIATRGRFALRTGNQDFNVGAGHTLAVPPCARKTKVERSRTKPFHAYLFKAPLPAMRSMLDAPNLLRSGHAPFQPRPSAQHALRDLMSYGIKDLECRAPTLMAENAEIAFEVLIYEHLRQFLAPDGHAPGPMARNSRQVAQALEFIHAHYAEPIATGDIARAAGIGERALQKAFMTDLGQTPFEFLAKVRVRSARERLLTPDARESVTQIALDCGLTHLGRFAKRYRETYGETPSQTLANNK